MIHYQVHVNAAGDWKAGCRCRSQTLRWWGTCLSWVFARRWPVKALANNINEWKKTPTKNKPRRHSAAVDTLRPLNLRNSVRTRNYWRGVFSPGHQLKNCVIRFWYAKLNAATKILIKLVGKICTTAMWQLDFFSHSNKKRISTKKTNNSKNLFGRILVYFISHDQKNARFLSQCLRIREVSSRNHENEGRGEKSAYPKLRKLYGRHPKRQYHTNRPQGVFIRGFYKHWWKMSSSSWIALLRWKIYI